MRMPLRIGVCCALYSALGACGMPLDTLPVQSQAGTTTTIVMVRHAERDPGLDPPLNDEGLARGQALVGVLGENGMTAIYAPDLIRNRQTAEPLAAALGLPVTTIPSVQLADTRALANQFVADVLENHAGGTVLWIGNIGPEVGDQSGNMQEIYARLGGTGNPPIRYQDIYTVIIPDEGPVRFIKATYGGVSSLD